MGWWRGRRWLRDSGSRGSDGGPRGVVCISLHPYRGQRALHGAWSSMLKGHLERVSDLQRRICDILQ